MVNKPVIYLATFLIATLTACSDDSGSSKKPKSRNQLVHAITATPENSFIERRFNATVKAPNTVRISSQVAGTITKMPHRPGAVVTKGQLLVQLDNQLFRAEYQKAEASLEKAEADYARLKKLIPKKLASDEEIAQAQTDLKLAKAELTLKKIQLQRSTIIAPFDGVISERLFEPGDSVTTNTHLLTLIDNQNFIVKSSVPESFLAYIHLQQSVIVYLPAFDRELKAQITSIYPAIDTTTQQTGIEVVFIEKQTDLYPGQFAEIKIKKAVNDVLLIPTNAVQYDDNQAWLYVINDKDKAIKTPITTGINISSRVIINSGLENGSKVITKGFVGLRPGKAVKIASDNSKASK